MSTCTRPTMPPKKAKLIQGQCTLFGTVAARASTCSEEPSETASRRRGDLDSWRGFEESKWQARFPWLDVRSDGIYCLFCSHCTARGTSGSGTDMFIRTPYSGTRPDVVARHSMRNTKHTDNKVAYRESVERAVRKRKIEDVAHGRQGSRR